VIAYNLAPVKSGDGGFACIPGSHKSNFLRNLPDDVRRFKRQVHYVVQPEVEVGDVVFFTEALIHGTMPWTAEGERRSLLYKYSPGHSAWSGNYYSLNDYEELSERQKLMLAPPSIGGRPSIVLDEDKG
jgi:ectoine hydroxylase-related dioxygenase (phytanoyl-CoA dioxygenase family)